MGKSGTYHQNRITACDVTKPGARRLIVHSNGNEEVVSAGEMYYIPPGHVFHVLEDAETVEFSPSLAYRQHMEKVARNMAAASRGDA